MRSITVAAIAAMQATHTWAITPTLIEISSAETAFLAYAPLGVLRFCNNTESLTYLGNIYLPYAFTVDYPGETEDTITNARLTIDATDQTIVAAVRSLTNPPTVTAKAMFFPDDGLGTFEVLIPWTYTLRHVSFNASSVSGDLIYEDRLDNQMGPIRMTAQVAPGLFG